MNAVNLLYSGLLRISDPRDVIEIGAKNDRVHPFHSPSVSSPDNDIVVLDNSVCICSTVYEIIEKIYI